MREQARIHALEEKVKELLKWKEEAKSGLMFKLAQQYFSDLQKAKAHIQQLELENYELVESANDVLKQIKDLRKRQNLENTLSQQCVHLKAELDKANKTIEELNNQIEFLENKIVENNGENIFGKLDHETEKIKSQISALVGGRWQKLYEKFEILTGINISKEFDEYKEQYFRTYQIELRISKFEFLIYIKREGKRLLEIAKLLFS